MDRRDLFMMVAGGCIGAIIVSIISAKKYEKLLWKEIDFSESLADKLKMKDEVIEALKTPTVAGDESVKNEEQVSNEEKIVKFEKNCAKAKIEKLGYEVGVDYAEESTSKVRGQRAEMNVIDAYVAHKTNRYSGPPEDTADPEPPAVVSFDKFCDEDDHHDKITLTYYSGDDTLCDENEEIIDNRVAIIGPEALHCFGMDSDDPDVVYVRNEKLAIDYDIIRVPSKYSEVVCGFHKEE